MNGNALCPSLAPFDVCSATPPRPQLGQKGTPRKDIARLGIDPICDMDVRHSNLLDFSSSGHAAGCRTSEEPTTRNAARFAPEGGHDDNHRSLSGIPIRLVNGSGDCLRSQPRSGDGPGKRSRFDRLPPPPMPLLSSVLIGMDGVLIRHSDAFSRPKWHNSPRRMCPDLS
jgi:hypothetical protein